jgi:ribosomal protein L28
VNLQAVKALVNGHAKRIRVCTGCIKDGKIAKA